MSLVADEAYGDNGISLYDSVVLTEKDTPTVERLINDAVAAIASRCFDICKYYYDTDTSSSSGERLYFYVPDLDETMEETIGQDLTDFIVLFTCNQIFLTRRPSVVPVFTEQAQAALNRAVSLLKSRKSPIKIW
ncbi:MAG: hypothetical protein IKW99_03530 [Bacteroidales bacterium]|nr:hypothetical protein [Bacteroidales bacterium]